MTTYTWTIETLEVAPELNGLTNVVTNVNWVFTGVNEINISGSFPGTSGFPAPDAADYIPYDQLTYETVCTWLESVNDMPTLYNNANIAIANVLNPSYGTDQFPWS